MLNHWLDNLQVVNVWSKWTGDGWGDAIITLSDGSKFDAYVDDHGVLCVMSELDNKHGLKVASKAAREFHQLDLSYENF